MTLARAACVFALAIAIAACVPDSKFPLSPAETASTDRSLIGEWRVNGIGKKAIGAVIPRPDGWADVVAVTLSTKGAGDDAWQAYRMFTSRVGAASYANVISVAEGRGNSGATVGDRKSRQFISLHYDVQEGKQVTVAALRPAALERLIAEGLPGVVKEGKLGLSVTVSARTAEFASALAKLELPVLLSSEKVRFVKRDPSASDYVAEDWRLSSVLNTYASLLVEKGHFSDAANIFSLFIKIYERRLGVHPRVGAEYLRYAKLLRKSDRLEEAVRVEHRGHQLYAAQPPRAAVPPAPH